MLLVVCTENLWEFIVINNLSVVIGTYDIGYWEEFFAGFVWTNIDPCLFSCAVDLQVQQIILILVIIALQTQTFELLMLTATHIDGKFQAHFNCILYTCKFTLYVFFFFLSSYNPKHLTLPPPHMWCYSNGSPILETSCYRHHRDFLVVV